LETSNKFKYHVENISTPIRLDKWINERVELKSHLPTRSFIQNLIENGQVTVNGIHTKSSYLIKNNDLIEVLIPAPRPTELIPYNFPLEIVFEDNDLIVVNKPAGLVVHPAAGHEQDTLVNALLFYTNDLSMKNEERPGIVHRIDKETSGLLVIAKNDYSHENLSQQFKNKTTHRIYYAITESQKTLKDGKIESYLARHPTDRKKYASLKNSNLQNGKLAITHFKYLESAGNKHLFQLKLETGRTHQIRVHLSENSHSIVGDTTYGYPVKKFKEQNLKRFYLHAAELGFKHPRTNEFLLFKSNWPNEDLALIRSWNFKYEF
jgi:23S rRNA pseudouridine1911/1915/1917 synthase